MKSLIIAAARTAFKAAGTTRKAITVFAEPTSVRSIEEDTAEVAFAKVKEYYQALVYDVATGDAKGGSEALASKQKSKRVLILAVDFNGWVLDDRCEFDIDGVRWKTSLCEIDPVGATAGFNVYS